MKQNVYNTTSPQPQPLAHPERFVDATVAADFLGITAAHVVRLARAKQIPAYPLSMEGQRPIWRFRLSTLVSAMEAKCDGPLPVTKYRPRPEAS